MVDIIINGDRLELFAKSKFPLSLQRKLVDFKDLASRKGEYSLTVKIPNSEHNRRLLNYNDNLNEVNKFRKGFDNECKVFINGNQILDGLFVLNSVNDSEISGYIISKVSSVSFLLNSLRLNEINNLEYDFEIDTTINENILHHQNVGADPSKVVLFGMVAYGNYFIPNSWNFSLSYPIKRYDVSNYGTKDVAPRQIFGQTTYFLNDRSNLQLTFKSIPPQHYATPILKAVFDKIGYKLSGGWINSFEAKQLLLPYVGTREYQYNWKKILKVKFDRPIMNVYQEMLANLSQTLLLANNFGITFSYKANGQLYPTGGSTQYFDSFYTHFAVHYFDTGTIIADDCATLITNEFVAPGKGRYKIAYSFGLKDFNDLKFMGEPIFETGFGATNYKDDLPQNLDNFSTIETVATGGHCNFYRRLSFENRGLISGTFEIDLEQYEKLTFWWSFVTIFNQTDSYTIPFVLSDMPPSYQTLFWGMTQFALIEIENFQVEITMLEGNEKVQVGENLPDIKAVDFVKSFINLFNLYMYVDTFNKVVYLENFNNFYLDSDLNFDVTERVELEKVEKSPPEMAGDYLFSWNLDDADAQSQKVYDYKHKTLLDYANEFSEIDSVIFCSTEFDNFAAVDFTESTFEDGAFIVKSTVSLPILVSNENFNKMQNEILSDRTNFQMRLLWFDGFFDQVETPILYSSTSVYSLQGIAKFKFKSFKELFFENYKTYLTALVQGYELNLSVSINAYVWNQLQINRPVVFNNVIFYIKSIDGYKPDGDGFSKLILFKCS